MVPGRRECELAVRGDDDIGNEVIMTTKDAFGVAVRILVTSELPHDDCLVYTKTYLFERKDIRWMTKVTVPREAVRMTSGVSEEVAIAVTQFE